MGKTTLLTHIAARKLAIPPNIDVLLCEQGIDVIKIISTSNLPNNCLLCPLFWPMLTVHVINGIIHGILFLLFWFNKKKNTESIFFLVWFSFLWKQIKGLLWIRPLVNLPWLDVNSRIHTSLNNQTINKFPERSATLLNFVGFQIFLLNYGLYTCTSDRFWSIYMKGDNPLLPDNVLTGWPLPSARSK